MSETQTMNLTEFLLQRIAEDEARAKAATSGPWGYNPGKVWLSDPEMLARYRGGTQTFTAEEFVSAEGGAACVATTGGEDDQQSMADAAHIARHDPARVLAECESKRRIVRLSRRDDFDTAEAEQVAEFAVHVLARIYADHPDYREEWKP